MGSHSTTKSVQSQTEPSDPHLKKQGAATQLIVDGQPFLIRAGELNNSSASEPGLYETALAKTQVATHLNTILATVSWELIEPEEGHFDFRLVDGLLNEARANDLHLVILWFGSWKNGNSTYKPFWVKTNQDRFSLADSEDGNSMPIMTTLNEANRDADARAFAALMRHLREMDGKKHTVIMIQVENEVGILGDSRDYSPAATKAFAEPVPERIDKLSGGAQSHACPRTSRSMGGPWLQNFRRLDGSFRTWQACKYGDSGPHIKSTID